MSHRKSDSYVVRKEQCPACRKLGHDKHGDNLAIYSDGHTFCYRCGYGTNRTKVQAPVQSVEARLALPADVSADIPFEARSWLAQYQLGRRDIQTHSILWSQRFSRLIFPYFDDTGLIAWQGRYIGTEPTSYQGQTSKPAKWYSQGKIHEIIHPLNVTKRSAVLVEDIVSAIKVSRVCGAIPIFGSSISTKQLIRLKTVVDRVWYWLDPDMRSKSVKMASMAALYGLEAHVIFSDNDPKEESMETIVDKLKEVC